ncbi:dipeptidase [Thermogemmatispora tikiterensis]|uniref:Peptidase M20 n=1 Tax=Thermogemmatispora tikiterensis TaxID=1825093 RepID=A0A328VGL4_9CHLR|nr:dipeptidase [Thermogemmatispora tikiterensis]RAQ96587.1 peptidase M20 [Thermogemmatispora tikiterensis]
MTQIEAYIAEHEQRFLEDLKGWLRIPSISTLPEYAADVRRAAEYAAGQLRSIGLDNVRLIETKGHPLVYGEWLKAAGRPTLLIYGHYDVQPVDPVELWQTPPFEPTIRGENLYCRGACDDKGQTMLVFKALETLITTEGGLPVNVRVLIEGEEEAGGESIEHYVRSYPERLTCDAAFICDTHMPAPDLPALISGLRGIIYTEVEARGAVRDLHSGTYGGIAPNPFHALALIIAGLKDARGHIHIPGLYDRQREAPPQEQRFWQEDPLHLAETLREEMGVAQLSGEPEYPPLQRIWARPTLEIHGFVGGFSGEGAKTVIPANGKVKISMRIPPDLGLKAEEVYRLFERRVKELAPPDVEVTVRKIHAGEGVLVSPEAPVIRAASAALKETYGREPVFIREGGSIPIAALFNDILQVPIVFMGFGLPDDNLHSPNEKYSLKQFFRGVRTVARFLQLYGAGT